MVASAVPSRRITLFVTPMLSVPAAQVSATEVADGVVAARPLGAVGGLTSIVHELVAGVGSVAPLAVDTTANVCAPAARPGYAFGLAQAAAVPPSSVQLNVAPCVVEWNVNVAVVVAVRAAGPLSMTVSGGGFAAATGWRLLPSRRAAASHGIAHFRPGRSSRRPPTRRTFTCPSGRGTRQPTRASIQPPLARHIGACVSEVRASGVDDPTPAPIDSVANTTA